MTAAARAITQRELWQDSALEYESYVSSSNYHRTVCLALIAYLPPTPRRVLDFGCGPGNSTALIATAYPTTTVVGVDYASRMVDLARSHRSLPNTIYCYIDSPGCSNVNQGGEFDAIVCSNSFFHIDDKEAGLRSFSSLLSSEGCILFSVYETVLTDSSLYELGTNNVKDGLMEAISRALLTLGVVDPSRKEDRECFSVDELKALFKGHGYQLSLMSVNKIIRSAEERLRFFRIPSVAKEMFPDLSVDVVRRAMTLVDATHFPVLERRVFVFRADRKC